MRNKFVLAITLILASSLSFAAPKPQKHAVQRTAHGIVRVAKFLNPINLSKKSLGAIAFTLEEGVDVAHFSLDGLDKAFSDQFKPYEPIHYAALLSTKADAGLEKAELYFFGSSN